MYKVYEVGEKIARIREKKGFSQEALAEKIGCSAITISRWENGHSHMKDIDVYKICKSLNIKADELLGLGENNISEKVVIDEALFENLSEGQRRVVVDTLSAMLGSIKSFL